MWSIVPATKVFVEEDRGFENDERKEWETDGHARSERRRGSPPPGCRPLKQPCHVAPGLVCVWSIEYGRSDGTSHPRLGVCFACPPPHHGTSSGGGRLSHGEDVQGAYEEVRVIRACALATRPPPRVAPRVTAASPATATQPSCSQVPDAQKRRVILSARGR